jgi:antibiotic biosynthesis monooxygenase (ABM) superfamily enzyme
MKPPKKWKMAIVVWLAIYPLITIVFLLFGKYLVQINPIPLRTLIMTLILVPLMVFLLMPLIQKLLKNWLSL